MKLRITIEMDNAAFDDPDELPGILRSLARRAADENLNGASIHDSNGNRVGVAKVTR